MIIDKLLQVSDAQAVTVTAPSTDVIDFGQANPDVAIRRVKVLHLSSGKKSSFGRVSVQMGDMLREIGSMKKIPAIWNMLPTSIRSVLQDDSLVVNEMAPRPHNSGHYTIDACDVSQFDLQLRTLTALPLVAPRQHSAAVMLNLLGDLWFQSGDEPVAPRWRELLALPGAHLHLYGKQQARRGRKMGHLCITGASVAQTRATARAAAQLLGLDAF